MRFGRNRLAARKTISRLAHAFLTWPGGTRRPRGRKPTYPILHPRFRKLPGPLRPPSLSFRGRQWARYSAPPPGAHAGAVAWPKPTYPVVDPPYSRLTLHSILG